MQHAVSDIFTKLLRPTAVLSILAVGGMALTVNATGAKAEQVDLVAVKASLAAALDAVEAESRVGNEFVLPLRTNAELADISAMCEFVLSMPDADTSSIPSICGAPETQIETELPFAGDLNSRFGHQFSHYMREGDVDASGLLLVQDNASGLTYTGG